MKGFVTLATGDIHYYELADNLLKSYRYRGGKFPFAILCDRRNNHTERFDDVVLLENTQKNYLDKLRILTESPYGENIFIEPDCLAYRNIDVLWDCFRNATDLSSFGWNSASIDTFLNAEDIEAAFHVSKAPHFCPGYMFVRKGAQCDRIYRDALRVSEHLIANKARHPKAFLGDSLRDDPVFFIAMELNGCTCACKPSVGKCIHYPSFRHRNGHYPAMDFLNGYLEDDANEGGANLCHFSSKHTSLGKYHQQVVAMNCYLEKSRLLGRLVETATVEKLYEVFWKTCYRLRQRVPL